MRFLLLPLVVSVCAFAGFDGVADPLPNDITRLRETYESGVEKLRNRYLAELKRRLGTAVIYKNADEVVAIKREINRVLASTMTGKWRDVENGVMYINPNGSLLHSNGATGTWAIVDDDMVLTWNNCARHIFPIVETRDSLAGTTIVPDRKFDFKMTRLEEDEH